MTRILKCFSFIKECFLSKLPLKLIPKWWWLKFLGLICGRFLLTWVCLLSFIRNFEYISEKSDLRIQLVFKQIWKVSFLLLCSTHFYCVAFIVLMAFGFVIFLFCLLLHTFSIWQNLVPHISSFSPIIYLFIHFTSQLHLPFSKYPLTEPLFLSLPFASQKGEVALSTNLPWHLKWLQE